MSIVAFSISDPTNLTRNNNEEILVFGDSTNLDPVYGLPILSTKIPNGTVIPISALMTGGGFSDNFTTDGQDFIIGNSRITDVGDFLGVSVDASNKIYFGSFYGVNSDLRTALGQYNGIEFTDKPFVIYGDGGGNGEIVMMPKTTGVQSQILTINGDENLFSFCRLTADATVTDVQALELASTTGAYILMQADGGNDQNYITLTGASDNYIDSGANLQLGVSGIVPADLRLINSTVGGNLIIQNTSGDIDITSNNSIDIIGGGGANVTIQSTNQFVIISGAAMNITSTGTIAFSVNSGVTYADNAAALAGGLVAGQLYVTTGSGLIAQVQ